MMLKNIIYSCSHYLSGHIVMVVTAVTYAATADTASLLSGQASSLPGAGWVVPGCGPSGPEDWGRAGAAGAALGGAASVVCCGSWTEEAREVRGLGGAGEEVEESAGEAELC